MGKLDALERKHADVTEAFEKAATNTPVVKKQIKPLQDDEAAKVIAEIEKLEETFEKQHAKLLNTDAFKISRGSANAYTDLNDHSTDVIGAEMECNRLMELATLFEFPDKVSQARVPSTAPFSLPRPPSLCHPPSLAHRPSVITFLTPPSVFRPTRSKRRVG